MSTPPIIGAVILGLQALDSSNNSVVFNRLINGLQNPNCSDAVYSANLFIGTAPFTFFQNARSGFFCLNKAAPGSPDVITITWTSTGVGTVSTTHLAAGAMLLIFEPSGFAEVATPTATSTNAGGTPVEAAWFI